MLMQWLHRVWSQYGPSRQLIVVHGDEAPDHIPNRHVYLARENEEDWLVAFRCPCGCGDRLELMLLKDIRPRWDITTDSKNRPTLSPSVHRTTRCQSHFFLRNGRTVWCSSS